MWSQTVVNPEKPGDFGSVSFMDDGWSSPEQQMRAYEMLASPEFGQRFLQTISVATELGKPRTFFDSEIIPKHEVEEFHRQWSASGLEHCLFSIYPLGPGRSSNSGIHRRIGKPKFTNREKLIVQTAYTQVDSLHRHNETESTRESSIRLSARERVTLHLVLAGHSHKVIAERLGISTHTVNDYVKSLHKIFEVGSRAELQAKFFWATKLTRTLHRMQSNGP